MKEYINKKVMICVKPQNTVLTYSALIKEVTDTHISFLDKKGNYMSFKIADIVEIRIEKTNGG